MIFYVIGNRYTQDFIFVSFFHSYCQNIWFFFIPALERLVQHLSPSLQDEFSEVCTAFDTTPNVTLDDETKNDIVEAIDTTGWDFVGPDFFEFLGKFSFCIFVAKEGKMANVGWESEIVSND